MRHELAFLSIKQFQKFHQYIRGRTSLQDTKVYGEVHIFTRTVFRKSMKPHHSLTQVVKDYMGLSPSTHVRLTLLSGLCEV